MADDFQLPDLNDRTGTATFILEEFVRCTARFEGRGQGWSGHLLTYGKAMMDLRDLGYAELADQAADGFRTYIRRIRSGPQDTDRQFKDHLRTDFSPRALAYAPSGYVLYNRGSTRSGNIRIWAVQVDVSRNIPLGEPFRVASDQTMPTVSKDGTLVYLTTQANFLWAGRLAWVDRQGSIQDTIGQTQMGMSDPALSPDGRQVAVRSIIDGNRDIWLHDVDVGTYTRLTTNPLWDGTPVWLPEGNKLSWNIAGEIHWQNADGGGAPELLLGIPPAFEFPETWSQDGMWLAFTSTNLKTKADVWTMSLAGDRTACTGYS